MPQPAGTKTLGDVITWVTEQFGDVAGVQIDAVKITRWANAGVLEVVNKDPDVYKVKAATVSIAGTAEYTFPVGIIEAHSVFYNGKPLSAVNFENMQEVLANRGSTLEQGTPYYWTEWGNTFQLWPIPNAVKAIDIYYTAKPAEMTVSADLIPLSDRYFPRICDYVMSKAQELDEDYAAAAATRQVFEDKLKEASNSPDAMQGQWHVVDDPREWDSY